MSRFNCVILAAGKGTRMVSKIPKILHPIMGKPMVHYVVETAREVQADRVIVVIGHGREMVESRLAAEGVMVAVQADQKGTAHALLSTEDLLGEGDILVLYGDVPMIRPETLRRFQGFFLGSEGITFMTTEVLRPEGYGRVILEGDHILDIVEDSEATGAVRNINVINTGICMIRRDLLDVVSHEECDPGPPHGERGHYHGQERLYRERRGHRQRHDCLSRLSSHREDTDRRGYEDRPPCGHTRFHHRQRGYR